MSKLFAETLFGDVRTYETFVDERCQAHVVVSEPDGVHDLLLHGTAFRNHLRRLAFDKTGAIPSETLLKKVIGMMEAEASIAPRKTLWNRVAPDPVHGQAVIWLDLGGQAVRVDKEGWTVTQAPAIFHRFSHQLPLPVPERGGDLRALLPYLNLRSEADQVLFLSSMVVALLPKIPQPILILHGPQGAAKTTAARLRRSLIDPSQVMTVMVRRDLGELVQALDHHYMPILDNLTNLAPWQEEVLCQAATGAAFTKRRLFTNGEDVILSFHRPVTLTGISLPSAAPDLLDRSLLITLERVENQFRRDESSLWASFEKEHPLLLGSLLTALSQTMKTQEGLAFTGLLRMADFTRYGTAAAMALGYSGDFFLEAMDENVVRQGEEVVDNDPLAEAVVKLVRREGLIAATATELLDLLGSSAFVPRQPAALGRRLNGLRAPLLDLGIVVHCKRGKGPDRQRTWILAGRGQG